MRGKFICMNQMKYEHFIFNESKKFLIKRQKSHSMLIIICMFLESRKLHPKHHIFKRSGWSNSTLGFRKLKFDTYRNTKDVNDTAGSKKSKNLRNSFL